MYYRHLTLAHRVKQKAATSKHDSIIALLACDSNHVDCLIVVDCSQHAHIPVYPSNNALNCSFPNSQSFSHMRNSQVRWAATGPTDLGTHPAQKNHLDFLQARVSLHSCLASEA